MACQNKVDQFVQRGWEIRKIEMRCGSTSVHGDVLLCPSCEWAARRNYPQGWRYTPGDICKHGNYVGDAGGPDYLCGQCEAGE